MAAKFVAVCAVATSALADAGIYNYGGYGLGYYGRGVAGHPYGGSSYTYRSPQGLGKRSADAEPDADAGYYGYGPHYYGYGRGIALHYGGGSSYVHRSPQGLGKRSADADADADAFYGYAGYGYGGPRYYGYGPGIAGHYGGGTSYVARSPQGLRGKRDAEPFGYYGPSRSYQQVTRSNGYYADPSSYRVETNGYSAGVYENNFNGFNRGKRSADAEPEPFGIYGYGSGSYQNVNRYNYGNVNSYSVATNGYAGQVHENNSGYRGHYAYGFANGK